MKLGSTRELSSLKPVLKDPSSTGPDPVYWVFTEVSEDKWMNVTLITPGNYNGEYPKTFGHYHSADMPEIYHLIEGEGVLVMQKRQMGEFGYINEVIEEVVLIKAKAGDEIVITPEWGHSWSNVGSGPLVSFDNWRSGHQPSDYETMERLQGMAYYLINEGGEVKAIKNPNYSNLPEPQWMTPEEFRSKYSS